MLTFTTHLTAADDARTPSGRKSRRRRLFTAFDRAYIRGTCPACVNHVAGYCTLKRCSGVDGTTTCRLYRAGRPLTCGIANLAGHPAEELAYPASIGK